MRAEFFHFNHLKPKFDKNLDFGKRVLVFTYHTIEQVKEIPDNWFKVVASIAPFVRCIHAEPFGFFLGCGGILLVSFRIPWRLRININPLLLSIAIFFCLRFLL